MYLASNSESDSKEEPDISLKEGAAWPGRTWMLIVFILNDYMIIRFSLLRLFLYTIVHYTISVPMLKEMTYTKYCSVQFNLQGSTPEGRGATRGQNAEHY